MDKKGTRILVGCILCTMIVLMLFIIVIKFTQLSCELVALEPVALRNSQLKSFHEDKPIRSHDKTILMKISAFLDYNVQEISSSDGASKNGATPTPTPTTANKFNGNGGGALAEPPRPAINNGQLNGGQSMPAVPPVAPLAAGASNQQQQQFGGFGNKSLPIAAGPQPSVPQNTFNPLQNSSFLSTKPLPGHQHPTTTTNLGQQQHLRAEKRFLPLELKSIETRNLGNDKHKYILSFNCTKLNMILVHHNNTVYVEKMDMELKPVGIRQKSTCVLRLPGGRAFEVPAPPPVAAATDPWPRFSKDYINMNVHPNVTTAATAAAGGGGVGGVHSPATGSAPSAQPTPDRPNSSKNMAHYRCDKPLRFECHYYNQISGPTATNGFLLADLQINAIEFATARSLSSKGDHKHVKSDFKGTPSECL